jgi:hypothetical protein
MRAATSAPISTSSRPRARAPLPRASGRGRPDARSRGFLRRVTASPRNSTAWRTASSTEVERPSGTGSASRKNDPYERVRQRGSARMTTPRSVARRTRRPTPWRKRSTASGRRTSRKPLPPSSSARSQRASTKGSSGTANGSLVTTSTSRASPGKSTPSQKLAVPRSTAPCQTEALASRAASPSDPAPRARCQAGARMRAGPSRDAVPGGS